MSIKAQYLGGLLRYFESLTQETVRVIAPVYIDEDFLKPAIDSTNAWGFRDTASATETVSADAPNGVLALALDATSEIQLAGIDWADNRTLVLNQALGFEARIKLSVLPTGAVIAAIGLCGDHNAAVDTVAESIWFRADGNGVLTVETDDTVNETSKVATGTTLTAGVWAILRIDCTDITDVKFYINGERVAAGTTFNMSQVAALALQPVARIGKQGAATTVGTLLVDYIRVWQKRT